MTVIKKKKRKLTEMELKWGEICQKCGKRKGSFMATGKAEGGSYGGCVCKD